MRNKGTSVGTTTLTPIQPPLTKNGSRAASLLFTGSSNIFLIASKNYIQAGQSDNGGSINAIEYIGSNTNITVN